MSSYAQEVTSRHVGLVNIAGFYVKIGLEKKREYEGKEIASAGLVEIPLSRPWDYGKLNHEITERASLSLSDSKQESSPKPCLGGWNNKML